MPKIGLFDFQIVEFVYIRAKEMTQKLWYSENEQGVKQTGSRIPHFWANLPLRLRENASRAPKARARKLKIITFRDKSMVSLRVR